MTRILQVGLGAVLLVGCGVPPVGEEQWATCSRISGEFTALYTLEDTDGDCSSAKQTSTDPMKFVNGRYVPPLDGLFQCVTKQDDCEVAVSCSTRVLPARMDFAGTLSLDGAQLTGAATLAGSFRGCTRVRYGVEATQAGMEPPVAEP